MKYLPLESPCKECIYKCARVEEPSFTSDKNCKYQENPIIVINEMLGVQEKLWKTKIN